MKSIMNHYSDINTNIAWVESAADDSEKQKRRNAVLYDLVRISDYNYGQFKTKIFVHNGVWNSTFDVTSLGLSAAATVIGGPAAQAMSAADTGLKGVQSKVAERWLQNQTAIALITSMDSSRAQIQATLYRKMTNTYSSFSIREGLQIVQEFDHKANLIDAMAYLQATIGNQAATNVASANSAKSLAK